MLNHRIDGSTGLGHSDKLRTWEGNPSCKIMREIIVWFHEIRPPNVRNSLICVTATLNVNFFPRVSQSDNRNGTFCKIHRTACHIFLPSWFFFDLCWRKLILKFGSRKFFDQNRQFWKSKNFRRISIEIFRIFVFAIFRKISIEILRIFFDFSRAKFQNQISPT